MANNRVYTESVVTLNNQEATARIDELRRKTLELRQEMIRLGQEKGMDSKEFRAVQKELISTEKSIKSLNEETKKYERVINNLNGSSLNELQSALRKTQQAMRRAKPNTEEFQAYSKTLKDIRARMREIENEGRQTQKVFSGFKNIFKGFSIAGLVTGAVAAIKKFAADMVAQTQLVGDKWRFETAGWKSAYGAFVADLSSGKGWSQLVADMQNAYRNGKQVAKMLDEIFERNNSLTLNEAEYNLEIEKQRKIMQDVTKSTEERIAAAEEIDRLQKQIALDRKDVAEEEMNAYKMQLQARTHLTDAELDAFVKSYNQNRDLIQQAQEYQVEYDRLKRASANAAAAAMMETDGVAGDMLQDMADQAALAFDTFKSSADQSVVYWAEIIAKYNLGNDDMVKNYVQARAKMVQADTDYERSTQRSDRQSATLRKQLAQEGQNAQNKAYQDAVKASDAHYAELQLQAKQAYADGELSEEQYQQRLTSLQEASIKDRIALGEKYKQSTVELQSQLLDLSITEKKKLEDLQKQMEADAQKALDDALAEMEREIEASMAELDAESQEWLDRWIELCEKANEVRREVNPVDALKDDMAEEMSALQEMYDGNLLSDEDFQKARLQIAKKYNEQIAEAQSKPYEEGIEAAQKYLTQVSDFISALHEAQTAQLEAQMQAELTAAGDNAEERERIEAEYAQKELDLKKRQANVDMVIQIAQAVAAGALASVQAWNAAGGNPVLAGVIMALVAATTVAQVAAIVAQRNAVMNTSLDTSSSSGSSSQVGQRVATGYSEGGYTGRRHNDFEEVGVVHANEWVAPAAMVRANPVVFAQLEAVRRSGNYHSGVSGFADGGSATAASAPDGAMATVDNQLLQRTYEVMSRLLDSLPLPAYLVLSQVNAKQELDAEIKKIVGKE